MDTQQTNIHVGKMIKKVLDEHGQKASWLAKQLHCNRTNVYSIFKRDNIDIVLLMRISNILNHNFFLDIANEHKLS